VESEPKTLSRKRNQRKNWCLRSGQASTGSEGLASIENVVTNTGGIQNCSRVPAREGKIQLARGPAKPHGRTKQERLQLNPSSGKNKSADTKTNPRNESMKNSDLEQEQKAHNKMQKLFFHSTSIRLQWLYRPHLIIEMKIYSWLTNARLKLHMKFENAARKKLKCPYCLIE
jgi:hypothetical protein